MFSRRCAGLRLCRGVFRRRGRPRHLYFQQQRPEYAPVPFRSAPRRRVFVQNRGAHEERLLSRHSGQRLSPRARRRARSCRRAGGALQSGAPRIHGGVRFGRKRAHRRLRRFAGGGHARIHCRRARRRRGAARADARPLPCGRRTGSSLPVGKFQPPFHRFADVRRRRRARRGRQTGHAETAPAHPLCAVRGRHPAAGGEIAGQKRWSYCIPI